MRDFKLDIDNEARPWKIANKLDAALGTAITSAKIQCYQHQRPPVVGSIISCITKSHILKYCYPGEKKQYCNRHNVT